MFILVEKFKFSQYYGTKPLKFLQKDIICFLNFEKLHNLKTHFCELLRPRAPRFQKIKRNPLNQVIFCKNIALKFHNRTDLTGGQVRFDLWYKVKKGPLVTKLSRSDFKNLQ